MKIQINNLVKSYAADAILSDLTMELVKGSKSAIVGENGAGKSTLLKILTRQESFQEGTLIIPKEMNVGYMTQVYPQFEDTSRAYILSAFSEYGICRSRLTLLEQEMAVTDQMEEVFAKYARTLEQFEQLRGYELENSLEAYAKGLGVFEVLDQSFNSLSGGQKTRIALVQLLLQEAEVLCLDEPTNHLDIQGIEWLENYIQASNKTIVVVSHDRQFLMNTVHVFHEIEDGQVVTYHGNYDSYRTQRHERYLRLVKNFDQQQVEINKLQLAIRRYRQWGHESNNEDFFKRAKAIEKRLERMEHLPKPVEIRNQLELNLESTQLGSKQVVIAEELVIGYQTPLTTPMTFTIHRKERFAIVAPNGKGKTTLLKTLLQEVAPLSGTIAFGTTIDIGYLPQIIQFDSDKERILQYIMRNCELEEEKARRYLARFGFYSGDMYKYISHLSGGEQVRLQLLRLMLKGCNCIILDEPTNHLDINSCEIIEDILIHFAGTILVISHDRMFLHKLQAAMFYLPYIEMQ